MEQAVKRCKQHPKESLTPVDFERTQNGCVIEEEQLYICLRCPAYLTERDVTAGDFQHTLQLGEDHTSMPGNVHEDDWDFDYPDDSGTDLMDEDDLDDDDELDDDPEFDDDQEEEDLDDDDDDD